MTRVRHIKEENAILAPQYAEQAAASEGVLIRRQMGVMRLIAGVTGRRNGDRSNYFSILRGIFIKVDYSKEIGSQARLVTRPDIQGFLTVFSVMLTLFPITRKCGSSQGQNRQGQNPYERLGIQSAFAFHTTPYRVFD